VEDQGDTAELTGEVELSDIRELCGLVAFRCKALDFTLILPNYFGFSGTDGEGGVDTVSVHYIGDREWSHICSNFHSV